MKSKLVSVIVISTLIILIVIRINKKNDQKVEREKQEIAKQEKIDNLRYALCSKYDIEELWTDKLLDAEHYRMTPVKTMEIQKLWISTIPIFFEGYLSDISELNESNYLVEFKLARMSDMMFFDDDFYFNLRFTRETIDSLSTSYPKLLTESFPEFNQHLFVVAQIDSLQKSYLIDGDGDRINVWSGYGNGLDITHHIEK